MYNFTMLGLYHVLNRGTDKRSIVLDDTDRRRFVRNLYEMNDARPVINMQRKMKARHMSEHDRRIPLVHIHAWCLMDNHYHILLSEIVEGGMSKFLQKMNMGYSKYFNERHARVGTLFQGKTKKVLIENERQFLYILLYIHCNPLDFLKPARLWRSKRIGSVSTALSWLSKYQWSSYMDYVEPTKSHTARILEGSWLFSERDSHVQELTSYLDSLGKNEDATLTLE